MDDYTIGRVYGVHGTQLNDLWLYEEQLSRWQRTNPTQEQQEELERLTSQLTDLRHVFTSCLALAEELGVPGVIAGKFTVKIALLRFMSRASRFIGLANSLGLATEPHGIMCSG